MYTELRDTKSEYQALRVSLVKPEPYLLVDYDDSQYYQKQTLDSTKVSPLGRGISRY